MSGHIVAMGGARSVMDRRTDPMHDYILELTGKPNPAVLFLGTATGDDPGYIVSFYETFNSTRCRPRHLNLFNREHDDITELVVGADVVHVGGGNTANMLDVWRRQGVDQLLHQALAQGAVLTGGSAGGICWFEGGTTDSWGPTLQVLREGLGMVKGSFCPHYDSGEQRRPLYHTAVRDAASPTVMQPGTGPLSASTPPASWWRRCRPSPRRGRSGCTSMMARWWKRTYPAASCPTSPCRARRPAGRAGRAA